MRVSLPRWTVTAAAVLTLAACNSGTASAVVKVSARGVDDAAAAVGATSRTIELSADDIGRLGVAANASDDTVRTVATRLDSQSVWQQSIQRIRYVYGLADGPIGDVALGVACDGLNGKIQSESQLYESLASQVRSLTDSQWQALVQATYELWDVLYQAATGPTEEDRVAAAMTCYVVQSVR